MLKELKQANDLLEEAISGIDIDNPNWDIPIAIIHHEIKPVAEELCDIDLGKLKRTMRNRIVLEVTRSHMLMDQIPLTISKE